MRNYFYTELACEQDGSETKEVLLNGITVQKTSANGFLAYNIPVKKSGIGSSLQAERVSDAVCEAMCILARSKNLPSDAPVTVICLGNSEFTADALGSACAKGIIATRTFKKEQRSDFDALSAREVSLIRTESAGHTGIEAYELLRACLPLLSSRLVIVIDSLRAASLSSLGSVIQISEGMTPGSGGFNARLPLNEDTLGIPVISIGAPFAIAASTLVCDVLKKAEFSSLSAPVIEVLEKMTPFCVTAHDAESTVKTLSEIITRAVNKFNLGKENYMEII